MADYLCRVCQRELGREVFSCPARAEKACAMQSEIIYPPQRREGFIFLCLSVFGLYIFLTNDAIWAQFTDDFFLITAHLATVSLLLLAIGLCVFFSYSMLLSRKERIWSEHQNIFWKAQYVRGYCYSVRLFSDLVKVDVEEETQKQEGKSLFYRLKSKYKSEIIDAVQELSKLGAINMFIANAYNSGHDGTQSVHETKFIVLRYAKDIELTDLLGKKIIKFLKAEAFPVALDELTENIFPETDTFAKVIAGEARSLFSLYALRISSAIFLLLFLSFTHYGSKVYHLITLKAFFDRHQSSASEYISSMFTSVYQKSLEFKNKGMSYIPSEQELKDLEQELLRIKREAPEQIESYVQKLNPLIENALNSSNQQLVDQAKKLESMTKIDELTKKIEKIEAYANDHLQGIP